MMTPHRRRQVIELLRCAADNNARLDMFGFAMTRADLGDRRSGLREAAAAAMFAFRPSGRGPDWRAACLEVAQRIEEGTIA